MAKYTLKVTSDFGDMYTGAQHTRGQKFTIEDEQRVRSLCQRGLTKIAAIEHEPKEGARVLFVSSIIYKIGGLETANRAISEKFKTKNIGFVTLNADAASTEQLLTMAKYHDVYVEDGNGHYECDVVIFQHSDSALAIDRIKARKYYQQVHNDLSTLNKVAGYTNFDYTRDNRITRYLASSETSKKGLKSELGIDSVVVPNIMPEPRRLLKMVVLSRASREKGIDRVLTFAQKLQKFTNDFVIFLAAAIEQYEAANELLANGHIVPVRPSVYNEALLDGADYLIQLSRSEAFCYSVREALQHKVPVIVSDLAEFRKVVKDGENGYILAEDMPDKQVKRIVEHIPTIEKPYTQAVAPIWHRVLKGEL